MATKEESGKPKARLTLSFQDKQQSKELEKAVAEKEIEFEAKNEVAAKPETRALLQIQMRMIQRELKSWQLRRKTKMGRKMRKQGNQRPHLQHQNR